MQSRVITTGPLQIKHQLLIEVLFFILALLADALYILHALYLIIMNWLVFKYWFPMVLSCQFHLLSPWGDHSNSHGLNATSTLMVSGTTHYQSPNLKM